jgi:hypothetical protein
MTESEIDEMIKHLEGIDKGSLAHYLRDYKEIFFKLDNIFKAFGEKSNWSRPGSAMTRLEELISSDSLSKVRKLNHKLHEISKNNPIKNNKIVLSKGTTEDITDKKNNELISDITEHIDSLHSIHRDLLDVNGVAVFLAEESSEQLSKTTSLYKILEKQIKTNENETKIKIDELNAKIIEAKKIATDNTLQKESEHFKEEADKLAKNAQDWLGGIICLVLFLVLISIVNILTLDLNQLIPSLKDNNIFFVYIFSRLSVGIILIYFLFFAIKNYRSIKHTEFIYNQKARILTTYINLSQNTSAKDFQGDLVRQIGRSVFEIHQTGYIKENQDKDSVENMNIVGEAASRLLKKE